MSEGVSSGPYSRVWLGFRRRDQTANSFMQSVVDLPASANGATYGAMSSTATIGDQSLHRELPDIVVLTTFASEDDYRSQQQTSANAVNLAYWKLLEPGKSKNLAAQPFNGKLSPGNAYLVSGQSASWHSGHITYVLLKGRDPTFLASFSNYLQNPSSLLVANSSTGVTVACGLTYCAVWVDLAAETGSGGDIITASIADLASFATVAQSANLSQDTSGDGAASAAATGGALIRLLTPVETGGANARGN